MMTIESIEGVTTLVEVMKIVMTLMGTMEPVVALEQVVLLMVVMLIKLIMTCRAQGDENYYAMQDTDHGYRPCIWEQRKHLERLTTFPYNNDYSSGNDCRSNYHQIDEHFQTLALGSRP